MILGGHGPTPWRLEFHETLGSTSDVCMERARAGEPAGLAVLAARQTAGRGSRGRTWQSPPGNLYLSVLLRPQDPISRAGLWSLLASVALRDSLTGEATLKWPNDLLLNGRKLAGILLDSAVGQGRLDWLVIGFGANLASAPPGAARLAAEPRTVALAVLERIDHYRQQGSAAVRAAWLAAAHPVGTELRFLHGGVEHAGSFAGITEEGALLLQTPEQIRVFSTGEVSQGQGALPPGPPLRAEP